jgi:hypothetical protein
MAALLGDGQQPAGRQLGQMPAGGLRRDTGRVAKLRRGQRPSIHQERQNVGAGLIAHEGTDFGETRRAHSRKLDRSGTNASRNSSAAAEAFARNEA